MYCEYFRLNEFPFSITPDTSYYYSSGASKEALNTLLVAANMGEGFIKVVGEIGTGKTLLCRKLIGQLQDSCKVAYIPNPYLDPGALFEELALELGIDKPAADGEDNPWRLLRVLKEYLIEETRRGGRVVICLDEAQSMPVESLEALRLLSNLETEKRKLLQVILFGQPELDDKLALPDIRQLRQRITFEYYLGTLTAEEVKRYVAHRLSVAGYVGPWLFTKSALWLLHRRSKGVPRLINILAHKALLSAFGSGARVVGLYDVLAASADSGGKRKFNSLAVVLNVSIIAAIIAFNLWNFFK